MRSRRTRLIRRILVALLLLVSGAVFWSLRRPTSGPAGSGGPGPAPSGGSTAKDVVFLRFREGAQQIQVRARQQVGQEGSSMRLQGVEVTFPYVAEGKALSAVIRSEECLYQAQPLHVVFRGKVHLRTQDGFELDTEQLDYSGDRGTTSSDGDVSFRQGGSSGTGRGMEYRSQGGELQLKQNVHLRIEQETGPPADVEAGSLLASRSQLRIFLDGGVVVHQGVRELRCRRLQLNMSGDFKTVERASAIEEADLRVQGAAAVPGAPAALAGAGEQRLRCRKLMMDFRARGVLSELTAVNPATLDILPGPGQALERRHVDSDLIRFRFDEQGRLVELEALGGGPQARRTVMTSQPTGAGRAAVRRVESLNARLAFDPASGALGGASFEGDVQFSEAGRRAWAREARFDEASGLLTLIGDPRVVDDQQGSELRARQIVLDTRTHGLTADESVRHTISRRERRAGAGRPLGGEEPTILLCRHFAYDAKARTARYRDDALMRSGRDEIRAPLIVIEEPAEGRRHLNATGGVACLLHQRPQKGQKREPAPIDTRSREMAYDESQRRVVFTGDVVLRQGDIVTKSPEAVVLLNADGGSVERVLAGAPVEVRQGARRATGERGTYTPADETLVLVGEKVVLEEADRRLEGRVLTFQVGSDRIRVDGREEVRSEAVLKRKDLPKP